MAGMVDGMHAQYILDSAASYIDGWAPETTTLIQWLAWPSLIAQSGREKFWVKA